MADTQWPRFQVFVQEKPGAPYEDAGSVHAPDAEIALLNARDVFVRRPACVSLWVARSDCITARTAEEMAAHPPVEEAGGGPSETYLVFQKLSQRAPHQHVGQVQAGSPEAALAQARRAFAAAPALVWWVLPDHAVKRSSPEDIAAMFEIAKTKMFRDKGEFRTVTAMREIAGKKKGNAHG